MTLVASALAGGDCIDDADVLRTGGTACTLGGTVKAPSTLGTFLRSFRWGLVRQLDRVSRELLARAWQAGAGPGDGPLTIDLDSTICETYGLAKEGARHHGYTGKRGYHPLLAIAAGTGDVLMSRLREGRGQHRPRRRPLPAGDGGTGALRRGQRTTHATGRQRVSTLMAWYPSAARWMSASPSPSASTKACTISSRRYPKMPGRRFLTGWTVPPMWPRPPATPFQAEADAAPVRLIVRRVKPTPGSQLALFAKYSYHGFITDRDGELLELEADHRRHGRDRECHTRPQVRRRAEPSPLGPLRRQRRLAGRPDDGPQPGPLDGADRSGRADSHHQDPPAAVLLPGRTAHPLGTPVDPASSGSLALG